MVNSIHSAAAAAQAYQAQTHQAKQPAPAKQEQPADSVVLSKQATRSADADHDGDSH
jgi:hypothetical protein